MRWDGGHTGHACPPVRVHPFGIRRTWKNSGPRRSFLSKRSGPLSLMRPRRLRTLVPVLSRPPGLTVTISPLWLAFLHLLDGTRALRDHTLPPTCLPSLSFASLTPQPHRWLGDPVPPRLCRGTPLPIRLCQLAGAPKTKPQRLGRGQSSGHDARQGDPRTEKWLQWSILCDVYFTAIKSKIQGKGPLRLR